MNIRLGHIPYDLSNLSSHRFSHQVAPFKVYATIATRHPSLGTLFLGVPHGKDVIAHPAGSVVCNLSYDIA